MTEARRIEAERIRRQVLWEALLEAGGPLGVPPHVLRHLGLYAGQQGIFVDRLHTGALNPGQGVTVSLLHKGTRYADDLAEDGVLYHYPQTRRPPGRDRAEIEATKAAGGLSLPVFVIIQPSRNRAVRDVQRGWVEDWDDAAQIFLVGFGDAAAPRMDPSDDEDVPFRLTAARSERQRLVMARPGQQRFKFAVIRRYGASCAVCRVGVPEVLDAAHLRPKEARGSDHPGNGLLLCALHHRAWDADLFAIHPETLALHTRVRGPTAAALRITESSIVHLVRRPHPDALAWRWRRWLRANAAEQTA